MAIVVSPARLARSGQSSVRRSLNTNTTPRVRKYGDSFSNDVGETISSAVLAQARPAEGQSAKPVAPPNNCSSERREISGGSAGLVGVLLIGSSSSDTIADRHQRSRGGPPKKGTRASLFWLYGRTCPTTRRIVPSAFELQHLSTCPTSTPQIGHLCPHPCPGSAIRATLSPC